ETYVTNLLVLDPENSAAVARSQECSNMQGRIGMAERVGFEPTVRFPARSLSRRVLSTTQPPLRGRCRFNRSRGVRFSAIKPSICVPRRSKQAKARAYTNSKLGPTDWRASDVPRRRTGG